jgi:DNA polymerase-3 subunit alpha
MAYLKATYPHEFYASLLRGMSSSTDKFYDYVREMKKVGITLELPSVNHSELLFKKEDDKLRIPLQNIKDVSLNFAQSIIEERTENGLFESFRTFVNRMSKRLPFKREDYVPLIEAGACDCFGLSRNTLNEHMKHMDIYLDVGFLSSELLKDRIEIEEIEDNIIENIENEYKRLGVTISGSLLINIDNEMKKRGSTSLNDIKLGKVDTYGIIKSIRKIKTRKNEDMAFMTISNYENEIDCVLFPETYANYAHLLQNNTLIQVKGKMDLRNNKEQIIIDEVIRLDDLDEKVNDN